MKHTHRKSSNRLLRLAVAWLGLLGAGFPLLAKKKAMTPAPGPGHFYAISYTFWDNGPAWDYHIIDVKSDGPDSVVRDILIISEHAPCGPTCRVRARIKRLKDTTPAKVAGDNNPCAVDQRELAREIRRSKRRRKHMGVYSFANFGIAADCGGEEVALHLGLLPFPSGPEGSPRIVRSYNLLRDVETQVFGTADVFTTSANTKIFEDIEGVPPPDSDEMVGEALVPELQSGAFDRALWDECKKQPCPDQGLNHALKDYIPPDKRPQPSVSLKSPATSELAKYVAPAYPPIANLARVEGDVELELRVDSLSGAVLDAKAITGHPLLQGAALAAARQWQFRRTGDTGKPQVVRVVLQFERNCPSVPATTGTQ